MRSLACRILALIICLTMPYAAAAEAVQTDETVVHTEFSLGLLLHADGFPLSTAHLDDWEEFLQRLTLYGTADTLGFWQSESRMYMEGALAIDGEDVIPFTYDGLKTYRYLITPALCCEPVLFQMHNFLEFMLKPFYYMEMPTPYIAVLLYPSASIYIADSYYAPVEEMMSAARTDALTEAGEDDSGEMTYVISYERLLLLSAELNAVIADDGKLQRVSRYCDALLSELYLADVVLDVLSTFELTLSELDPDREGMTVTETADGITCTLGGIDVFQKTTSGDVTEIAFQLPVPGDTLVTVSYRADVSEGTKAISLSASILFAQEEAVTLLVEGDGLPVEGALSGAGSFTMSVGGYLFEETPVPLAFTHTWSRTAAELPYTLEFSVDWIHHETQLPAITLWFSGTLEQSDYSVFDDAAFDEYPTVDFFSLNADLLSEYKERWGYSLATYLVPVVMEMPLGVIDDVVNYLLDEDILLSLVE